MELRVVKNRGQRKVRGIAQAVLGDRGRFLGRRKACTDKKKARQRKRTC